MMYFTAVIDVFSRKILAWELSDNMKPDFCLHVVRKAIARYGVPAIFNTDQGSTYTCREFIQLLEENSIEISMRLHQGLSYLTPDQIYNNGIFSDAESKKNSRLNSDFSKTVS